MAILFLDLVLLVLAVMLLLALVTQIFIPLKNGTRLFPFFHQTEVSKKVDKAVDELEEVAELERLNALQEQINRRKAQLKKDE